ncbi:disease resistance protein TAO1-like isoform X4 [Prunus avium]|nr:disease resistance protein TAO1-like isoform X4 [Prunus avium]
MMLKHFKSGRWVMLISSSPKLPFSPKPTSSKSAADSRYFRTCSASADALHILRPRRALSICWAARRRAVRYDDDGEDEEEEEYGHHKEIAVLELYSQSVRGEALIVHAVVDDQDVQVLIFKATNKIKGIALRMARLEKADWNCEAFSKMCNLKVLEFYNVIISSSPKILPNSLRSIKWSRYPSKFLPSGFQSNFLFALEMRGSKLVRLWDGRKDLPNLKKMDLSDSENLTTTPDFSGIPNLEVLYFGSCTNLVEIDPSIADLKCLKTLVLSYCSKLKKIPEFSGQMKNLSWLSLQQTSIEKLPSSIGCLVGLTFLFLDDCKNLAGLPSEICNLKSLTVLQLYGTSIRQLPRSVVGLKKLYRLDLGRSGSQPNKSRFWWTRSITP